LAHSAGVPIEAVIALGSVFAIVFLSMLIAFWFKGRADVKAIQALIEGGALVHWTYHPTAWIEATHARANQLSAYQRRNHYCRDDRDDSSHSQNCAGMDAAAESSKSAGNLHRAGRSLPARKICRVE
jgi:hypothetical protein